MDKYLFLWGAPCRETRAEAQLLRERGYTVRTLRDEIDEQEAVVGPKVRLQLRTMSMLSAAAVVMDTNTPLEDQRRCGDLCRSMGVRCVISGELPFIAPEEYLLDECLDSLDHSGRYACISARVYTPVTAANQHRLHL